MSSDDKDMIKDALRDAGGFTLRHEAVAIKDDEVMECSVVATKGGYDVLYMEIQEGAAWRRLATKAVMDRPDKCLIFTASREAGGQNLTGSTTTGFEGQRNRTARHVVIAKEKKTVNKFMAEIKKRYEAAAGANVVSSTHVDEGVQGTITRFSEYNEAFKEFGENLAEVIKKTKAQVRKAVKGNKKYQAESAKFLKTGQKVINKAMTENDVEDMLVQHILTSRIFAMVYDNQDFHKTNTVARSLENLKNLLNLPPPSRSTYQTIELIAESITDSDQRQEFLKRLYETYYNKHDPEKAKKEGIVYTPLEVVNFMVKSVNHILKTEFSEDFSDDGVAVLDPCTGTGTFLVRVMHEIGAKHLDKKYDQIYANDVSILPYYIAALNIENTYKELRDGNNREFKNICWMDTLDGGMKDFGKMTSYIEDGKENVERIRRQQDTRIDIVIGNPPYAVMQNKRYEEFDKKIIDTYAKKTKEINPDIGSLMQIHDSYIRFFRWASSRIKEKGIVAYVTNGAFIKSEVASGMRACLYKEFTDVWCFDLRGDQRTQGETSRKEGGKIFGSGSRAPVAITILVKNPKKKTCSIHYKDIGDYLTREEKLEYLNTAGFIGGIEEWKMVNPDLNHDWLDQRNPEFYRYMPIGSKNARRGNIPYVIFRYYSSGLKTGSDIWIYNSSEKILTKNIKKLIDVCYDKSLKKSSIHSELLLRLKRITERQKFDKAKIRPALYRPFFKQYLYFDSILIQRKYQLTKLFPEKDSKNLVIIIPYKYKGSHSVFITDIIPDLSVVAPGQCFTLYYWIEGQRIENILDSTLQKYREFYDDYHITKKDIFHYLYGLLHHEGYKEKFKNNLLREFPTIPMAPNFLNISENGKKLTKLHLEFDTGPRHPLKPKFQPKSFTKLNFAQRAVKTRELGTLDTTKIKIDDGKESKLLFEDIPEITYRVNGRTPVEWIVDRFKKTCDKKTGITNDPCTGIDIVAVIERAVYVGIESDRLIKEISILQFEPDEADKPPIPKEKTKLLRRRKHEIKPEQTQLGEDPSIDAMRHPHA